MSGFLGLLVLLALIGLITWALVTYIPMPQGIKTVIVITATVVAVLYVLHAFGISLPNPSLPRVR